MTTTATVQRSDLIVYNDQVIQNEYDLPRGTCLGAGCCDWCGRELGDVKQTDGTTHDYHDARGRCLAP